MQIKSIVLYSSKGEMRILPFEIGKVNIITGKSGTGKSAVIDIVDYCLGRSTFNVFEGVNRDVVAWYSVLFQFENGQVFIAKPAPKGRALSQSQAYWSEGSVIEFPNVHSLILNTNDDGVKKNLSRLLGIAANETIVNEGRSMIPFESTIDHAKFYLFQDQGLVANRKMLFWRQSEPMISQHIKDTIGYFLGAINEERLDLIQKLREERRQLRMLQRELKDAENIIDKQSFGAKRMLNEAKLVGLWSEDVIDEMSMNDIISSLEGIAQWNPLDPVGDIGQSVLVQQQNIKALRSAFRSKQEEIKEAENYIRRADGFKFEVNEQASRLSAVQLFSDENVDHTRCPVCDSSLQSPTPSVANLSEALRRVRESADNVQTERPRIEGYQKRLNAEIEKLKEQIRDAEQLLASTVQSDIDLSKLQDFNILAARVAGRVSLYLESVASVESSSQLLDRIGRLSRSVEDLEGDLNVEHVEEAIASILNIIGARMTLKASSLKLEHFKNSLYRLDIKRLTVVADSPGLPIPMERMGSAENYLGCHLLALLSLHEYFIKNKRPVPNFLILDQPSQVYFPSREAYLALDGKAEGVREAGADVAAVQRMFDLLFETVSGMESKFQIIVLEHANLDDSRFQKSLVESPWTDGGALIPSEWLS